MKRLFCAILLSLPITIYAQSVFINLEQHHGISGFSRNTLPYKVIYSYEYGTSMKISLSNKIAVEFGTYFQHSGTASDVWFEEEIQMDQQNKSRQSNNMEFLKIPIDVNFNFGKNNRLIIGIGAYYSIHLMSTFETNSEEGYIFASNPSFEEMNHDNYGIRISPSFLVPIYENIQMRFGLMQEIGLFEYIPNTRLFATYLTAGITFAL